LFDTIEVKKFSSGQEESYSTDEIVAIGFDYTICSDHIPTPGVNPPVETWAQLDYSGCSNCLSYGIIPDTNIGYISSYAWYGGSLQDFQEAVEELWDTDALIIDQRFNLGGVVPFLDYGIPTLFNEDINPLVNFYKRDSSSDDYTDLVLEYVADVDADEETYYDHPIAILTGPKSGSAGDLCPYALSHHPRARSFGRPTAGAFGQVALLWSPDPYLGDLTAKYTVAQMLSADGEHLNAWDQEPDQSVWLNAADAAVGIDTVLNAALDWIDSELTDLK